MDGSLLMNLSIATVLFLCLSDSEALECELDFENPYKVAYSIVVDKSGAGNFTTIQSAIDSIPSQALLWIRIQISSGIYWEKVTIPHGKTCIFLDGAGSEYTEIQWDGYQTTESSAAFTSFAENLLVKGITFRNVYNSAGRVKNMGDIVPAAAALIEGDKSAFYECRFIGLQDTLWDGSGRHYYNHCFIEGAIDFISGSGQSIYENCDINVSVDMYAPVLSHGYITAQDKNSPTENGGFVFKSCRVIGSGRAFLGRAYRPFSTVIFYASELSALVDPAGWDAWHQTGNEMGLTFAEVNCEGEGADTSRRVPWLKQLSEAQVNHFVDISYIDQEGWTTILPIY